MARTMGPVDRRPFGKTGEHVSIIGIGGADAAVSKERSVSIAIMHEAIDAGVNLFDNCWEYHDGYAEEVMGEAIHDRREKVFLMTKVCGRTYEDAKTHLEDSLRRLRTEYLDLWQFHGILRESDPGLIMDREHGALRAALEARQAGKVRYIGFTGHADPKLHLQMLDQQFEWDAVQMPTNVVDAQHKSFERQVLPACNARGISVLGMKSLASQAGRIVREVGITANTARRYALSLPITSLICGDQTLEELHQDLELATGFTPLSKEEISEALKAAAPFAQSGEVEDYKINNWGCNFHAEKAAK